MTYVCSTLDTQQQCVQWVEQTTIVDELAITRAQASDLSVAICASLVLGWIIGEIGSLMKNLLKR
ncbi:hypothetical protein BTV98_13115 [Psychrobacter sp. Cmf 22.2]|nr:hypothetical protein BTV98_13115 [Psychrobacter sp. Cmf 22.2]|tara:strand:- start:1817 stop:2011 length:195 start_codon:yes stop_codon:yes gene_type:complete